jgi:hypothetical protein
MIGCCLLLGNGEVTVLFFDIQRFVEQISLIIPRLLIVNETKVYVLGLFVQKVVHLIFVSSPFINSSASTESASTPFSRAKK